MKQRDIRDLSYDELVDYFSRIEEKPYRATQIFEWIYQKGAEDIGRMTNLSSPLRNRLKKDFVPPQPPPVKKESALDQTKKFLFNLEDNENIETVLIPSPKRTTVCVSTQAGCKFGCRFCASGIGGWNRNLTCAEILGQVLFVQKAAGKVPLTHIVFMGIGEPVTTVRYNGY